MSLQERLKASLKKLEDSGDAGLIDQAAYLLAHFEKAEFPIKRDYVTPELPKLLAQLDDCLGDLAAMRPAFAFLAAGDWQNREDDVGDVATCLIKIYK